MFEFDSLRRAALAGCASVPKEAGFSAVRQTVEERTNKEIRWNQGNEADHEAERAVADLLSRPLTADSAVQVALLNNQNLQATYEELGIAQAELVEAGLLRNPVLSADVRFPRYAALPFDISVSESFVDLLSMPLRKKIAGAAFEAAKLRVTSEVLAMAARTESAFFRVQGAAQLLEMRRTILAAASASFDAADRIHQAGNISDLALADERSQFAQTKLEVARAEADLLDAREELNALMGVSDPQTQWTVMPRLADLPPSDVESGNLESAAIRQRADLGAARQEVERSAQSLGLTQFNPLASDVTIGANVEKETDSALSSGPAFSVPLPLFNQGQPAIAAARARLRQSLRHYQAMDAEVRSEVRRARNRMTADRRQAEYYASEILPIRHRIVQQMQLQYNGMLVGVFQLLAVREQEIDAGREYVEALRDYWMARAELKRAVGGRLHVGASSAQPTSAPATQPVSAGSTIPVHHSDGETP